MKKYIDKVTVTGASDDTSISEMRNLQSKYPFVEWGILLSRNLAGRQWRFPSRDWLKQLFDTFNDDQLKQLSGVIIQPSLQLSGHLCGKYVNEILLGIIKDDLAEILESGIFKRIQINTHGIATKWDGDKFNKKVIQAFPNIEFIFQYDKVNQFVHYSNKLYNAVNISALYDLSHGAGVLPSEWDKPLEGIYTGYAGGLSPDNLESQLLILDNVVGHKIIWIDAETHLRSDDDQFFDLSKVEKFLQVAKSRVIYNMNELDFIDINDDYLMEELGFCGCGDPTSCLLFLKQVFSYIKSKTIRINELHNLKITHLDEKWNILFKQLREEETQLFSSIGIMYFVYYFLDKEGFTEHGGSVPGWLTDKGEMFLQKLDKWEITLIK